MSLLLPAEITAHRLSVRDVLALDDAELADFMRRSRAADNGFNLDIEGWDLLADDDQDHLAERLKC